MLGNYKKKNYIQSNQNTTNKKNQSTNKLKPVDKFNETKNWFPKKMNKISKPLARVIRKKER